MAEPNYLKWIAEQTPTAWWHDSADAEELKRGKANAAAGLDVLEDCLAEGITVTVSFTAPQVLAESRTAPLGNEARSTQGDRAGWYGPGGFHHLRGDPQDPDPVLPRRLGASGKLRRVDGNKIHA